MGSLKPPAPFDPTEQKRHSQSLPTLCSSMEAMVCCRMYGTRKGRRIIMETNNKSIRDDALENESGEHSISNDKTAV